MRPLSLSLLAGTIFFCLFTANCFAAEGRAFGGVGLQVVPTITGNLVVLNVLEKAPAAEKGLQPGDLIYKVDDFVLQGSDFAQVVSDHLWGPVGTSVELHYLRPGLGGAKSVILKRTAIDPRLTVTPAVQSRPSGSSGAK